MRPARILHGKGDRGLGHDDLICELWVLATGGHDDTGKGSVPLDFDPVQVTALDGSMVPKIPLRSVLLGIASCVRGLRNARQMSAVETRSIESRGTWSAEERGLSSVKQLRFGPSFIWLPRITSRACRWSTHFSGPHGEDFIRSYGRRLSIRLAQPPGAVIFNNMIYP